MLFEAGSEPTHLLLLTQRRGRAARARADARGEPRFRLSPIAPIGELGAVTGLRRNTTAVTAQPSEVWRIGVADLRQFFEKHGDVAFPFYHNLLNIVADKVRRDTRRLDEVRANLIRTQKGMKRLLEPGARERGDARSPGPSARPSRSSSSTTGASTTWSSPRSTLTSWVRLDGGATVPVREISDSLLRLAAPPAPPDRVPPGPAAGTEWSGVLITPGGEVPVSGKVEQPTRDGALIKLDLFIDQYAAVLRDYLTRVQMLDFVV